MLTFLDPLDRVGLDLEVCAEANNPQQTVLERDRKRQNEPSEGRIDRRGVGDEDDCQKRDQATESVDSKRQPPVGDPCEGLRISSCESGMQADRGSYRG